jgi:predicted DNA-binding transcriptional regulator YafY
MLDASARLLRLLSLLQARPEWAGAELAARLGITPRTVRRDVQRLRDLGYPVDATPGVAGGYRLGPGGALPPLLLEDDEAVAVAIGLRTAAGGSVTGIAESSLRALAKLEQVLPVRLRHRVAALQVATVPLVGAAAPVDPDTLTVIAVACRGQHRIRFSYRDRTDSVSDRHVEPHRLVHTGRRWYLVARDLDRDDWRTFRVDRIDAPRPTGVRFVPRDPPDAGAFVAAGTTSAPYRHQARILVRAGAEAIAERVPPTVGVVQALDPHSCLLTTGSDSLDALAVHLATLGADFTVLEPPELRDRIGVLAGRLQRATTTPAPATGP